MAKLSTFIQDVIATMVIPGAIIIGALHFQAKHKDLVVGLIEGTDGYSGYMFANLNKVEIFLR